MECCWGRVRSWPRRVGGGGARFWPFGWYGLMSRNAYGCWGFALQAALDHPGRKRTIRRRSFDKCLTRLAPAGRRAKAMESAGKSMLDVGDAAPQPLAVELQ